MQKDNIASLGLGLRRRAVSETCVFQDGLANGDATRTYAAHVFCDREYHDWSGLEILGAYEPR